MINAETVIKVPNFARDMYRDLYNDYNEDFRHAMDIDYYILRKIIKQKRNMLKIMIVHLSISN